MTLMVVGLFKDSGTGSGDGETPSAGPSMSVGMIPVIAAMGPFFYLECHTPRARIISD